MSLFQLFVTFGNALIEAAKQNLAHDEAFIQQVSSVFSSLTPAHAAVVEEALCAFFDQPPAHIAAVNGLDHTQFVNVLNIPHAGPLCLRSVLATFSSQGPIPYGRVWLPLLDVAEKANPVFIKAKAGREYIQQQMVLTVPANPMQQLPSAAQLDNIMGSVLSAFPGLQDCITKIAQGASNGGETDLNSVVDQVQNVLLGPLMQNIKSTNPDQSLSQETF